MSTQYETSDSYQGEIVRRGSHRAIICRDGIQFILQRRMRARTERSWEAVRYCTTKKALIRLSTDLEPRLLPELEALPDHARAFELKPPAATVEQSAQEAA